MAEHHTKKCLKIAWFNDVDIEKCSFIAPKRQSGYIMWILKKYWFVQVVMLPQMSEYCNKYKNIKYSPLKLRIKTF